MYRNIIIRYAVLALSILGSATLLYSCSGKGDAVVYDYETLLTESSENRTITMMENGQRSYIFTTPLIEGYSMATNPYQEFRRGIEMTTFTSDSLSLVDVIITANYAIYYEKQKLWEAKGNVIINKFNRKAESHEITDTTKVYTQQLFWNGITKKVYSNVDTKVLQKDGWHFGVGFDADEDLKNIHFRKYSSEIEFEMREAERRNDNEGATGSEQSNEAAKGEKGEKGANRDSDVKTAGKDNPAKESDNRATSVKSTPQSAVRKGDFDRGVPQTPQSANATPEAKVAPPTKGLSTGIERPQVDQQRAVPTKATISREATIPKSSTDDPTSLQTSTEALTPKLDVERPTANEQK